MPAPTVTPPAKVSVPRPAYERSTHSRTLGAMFLATAATHEGPALRWHDGDGWVDMAYPELGARVRELARGLIGLELYAGDRVAILGQTTPEWTVVDAASLCAGAVVAPIYHTNSPEECLHVLAHSEARLVFCEDAAQLAKIAQVRDRCPRLEHVVALRGGSVGALSLDDVREAGAAVSDAELEDRVAAIRPDDLATLVYTSGTTGPPKGCMLTHRNFTMTMQMYEEALELTEGTRTFMFLPLAHSMARIIQMLALDVGSTLTYWRGDATRLLDDVAETRPTHLAAVPRVFEKVHARAVDAMAEGGPLRRGMIAWALRTGHRARDLAEAGRGPGPLFSLQHRLADRLVLRRIRALFGGELRLAVSGAAPIPLEVMRFFDACGVVIREAWGMSETTAAGTLNTVADYRFGTVGRPLAGVEVRIAPDGEVLIKGGNVQAGYYRDRRATRASMDDGWLSTGDLGVLEDGYLSITGRKKELIITSSGKNITPVNIENALRTVRWIGEAIVYGDNRPYLVAAVTLDPDEAAALAEHVGLVGEWDAARLAGEPAVRAEIDAAVERVNAGFARIEQVKRVAILDHELTQAAGELTPTLKVKRGLVYDRYADLFASLYDG